RLRPDHRRRQRPLRPDRPQGGQLRRWIRLQHARLDRGSEEGEGDLVPLPPVRRAAGAADGAGQRGGARRPARGRDGEVVPGDAGALADGAADAQVVLQRGPGRPGRSAGAGRQRHPALLHDRGGEGGARRVQGEAESRLRQVPAAAVMEPLARTAPAPVGMRVWLMAARPRTLTAAVVPVLVGTAVAAANGGFHPLPALAAFLAAICIQIGTNFANDFHDFERGADTHERLGPVRVTQSGLVAPRTVRSAALLVFGGAFVLGIYLAVVGGWPILLTGLASIAAGWAYTGGPWPFGYHGLGDLFVFVFFGLVATAGTVYVQLRAVPTAAWIAAVPVGSLATAILVVNNLRDIATDGRAGKRTLAVRLGPAATRAEYVLLLAVAFAAPFALLPFAGRWALLPLAAMPLAAAPLRLVFRGHGAELNAALGGTARLHLAYGALLAAGLVL